MSKEVRKSNVVDTPTMIIGVGGTGCKIVKKVHKLCSSEERENVSFVCLDTDVNDLKQIKEDANDIFTVQTSNTQTVGSYLDSDRDASNNWFPKNAVIFDKTVSEGAGQLRAISRLALNSTIKTGKIAPLFEAIDALFLKSGQAMKQAIRISVVSTASGGTGSGMILPFCMYVRDYINNKYPNASVILRTLILLPETLDQVITSNIERDSQRRNAYATIKEFNAFMMKGSGFCAIEPALNRYKNLYVDLTNQGRDELKRLSCLPCDFCFLLDGQDAEDSTSISFEQYKDQAALSLYEQMIGPMKGKASSVEDNIIKELANPGNYGRNRFGGIGAGRIVYPYEDVIDYIAYDWAKDSIGGEGEASKWLRYDNMVKNLQQEEENENRRDRTSYEEAYVNALKNDENPFTDSLKKRYNLNNTKKTEMEFFKSFDKAILDEVLSNTRIHDSISESLDRLSDPNAYNVFENRKCARDDFDSVIDFYNAVKEEAEEIAKNKAKGILRNDLKSISIDDEDKNKKYIESFLRSGMHFCHPNAARYKLYSLYIETKKKYEKVKADKESKAGDYDAAQSPYTNSVANIKFGNIGNINSLSKLCDAIKKLGDPNANNSKGNKEFNKISGKIPSINEFYMTAYEYMGLCCQKASYEVLLQYIKELNDQYKKFFNKFNGKIQSIDRKQQDIVDALKFKKGDSYRNICASKDCLSAMSIETRHSMEKSQLLDDELNAQIFDQIKANAQQDRESKLSDIVIFNTKQKDIFDDTIVGYFKRTIMRECNEIVDLNIIKAISKENEYKQISKLIFLKKNDENEDNSLVISTKDAISYIKSVIEIGRNISAPGIQKMIGVESRGIEVAAFNNVLTEDRNFRINELIPNGIATDTVSKYELHFYNALYNLTPDKLKKFSAPKNTETGKKTAGLYHDAYTTYTRDIGPDCLKSSKMTTHIDRRWDSIATMPELDLDYQHKQFLRTHKALIYGLIFNRIEKMKYIDGNAEVSNPAYAYRYKNSQERIEDMIVSNGTLCDEFYEIVDSLYIDRKLVEDIYAYERKVTAKNMIQKVEYENTEFNRYVQEFRLDGKFRMGEQPGSLFEIPLAYYYSLPSSLRDEEELSCMVDAVIEILSDQIKKHESEKNAKFILCDMLKRQFDRLIKWYETHDEVSHGVKKNENKLLDIIKRKIQEIYETSPQPEKFEVTINEMQRALEDY